MRRRLSTPLLKSIMRRDGPRTAACWLTAQYIRLVRATGRWTVEGSDIPEGLIAAGTGSSGVAEARFLEVREGFLREGNAYDAALVSLDLAGV